ncbi:ABC transporter permease [Subtercola frigoramans]|uniref:Ribose/xylose/arabinose/galactoside ABC-type transport system permease subunit n=1 Tax=Subtercola frigoramans TaxID=120298 RepID=A0ABS2L0P6_9MICO|nr:ABC transporter permease [Subtercola frigoramans]MBM7470655.1 ribose/xylose/arabinose/galactoside ABC-type transport system permease subunit [Subtercola frigoramans]
MRIDTTTSAPKITAANSADDAGVSSNVRLLIFLRDRGIIVLWIVLVIFFAFWASPYFFTLANAGLIANAAALAAIFGAAVGIGILSGALDLSIPGSATIAAVVGAISIKAGAPAWLCIVIALLVGASVGIVNGLLVQRGLNPLVVTIAMLTTLGGLAQVISGGVPVTGITQLKWMGSTSYLGIPAPVFVVAIVFIAGWLFLTQTRAGARVLGVGGNIEAVRRAGVNADRYRILGFVLSGIFAAVGGLLVMATTTQASPNPSVDLLFSALTAVALSGMPLTGGRGSLPRVLVGALIIVSISSALIIRGIPPYWATIVTGVLLVLALAFEKLMSSAVAKRLAPAPTATLDTGAPPTASFTVPRTSKTKEA